MDEHLRQIRSLRPILDYWINLGVSLDPGRLFETEAGLSMDKEDFEHFELLVRFGESAIQPIEAAALSAMRAGKFENAGTLCVAIGCIGGTEAFPALTRLCNIASRVNRYECDREMIPRAVRGIAYLARDDSRAMSALPEYGEKYRLTPMIDEVLERRGVKPINDAQAVAAEFVKGNVETLDLENLRASLSRFGPDDRRIGWHTAAMILDRNLTPTKKNRTARPAAQCYIEWLEDNPIGPANFAWLRLKSLLRFPSSSPLGLRIDAVSNQYPLCDGYADLIKDVREIVNGPDWDRYLSP